jgi:two-component system, cell cycle sensor histidine kinase PleC
MLSTAAGPAKQTSLMAEYATLLADSVLRHKAWLAEHTAQIETDLANKIKSEFIANMSHELRTPLNTVIGFAKLLSEHNKRPLEDTEVVEYGDLIRAAASHLLAVINDILDISKMQSGKLALDAREVELEEILQVAVASFQSSAAEAGVTLECRLDPVLPAVKGDPAKLRQVFANLIGNAIKFTPRGGTATLEAGTGAGGAATVRVRDTGLGMTAEEIAVALTPFGQVDATRSRWREGTGLGLPIARALVQLHGGHLEIRSTKSQGTEVTVALPAGADISDMHGRQAPRDAATSIHGTGIHGHGSL